MLRYSIIFYKKINNLLLIFMFQISVQLFTAGKVQQYIDFKNNKNMTTWFTSSNVIASSWLDLPLGATYL